MDTNRWTEAQIAEIKVVLLESAAGMFRLLDYQLREIRKCYTIQAIKKKLNTLPRDLNDMYERILSMLGDDLEPALELLKWLAFSIRPLRLEEVLEIGVVNLHSLEQDGPMAFDQDGRLHEDFVLGACSGLVTVNEGIVKLVHLSIKEHIFSSHSMSPHKIDEPHAQLAISQTCLVYLAYSGEAAGSELDRKVELGENSALNQQCPLYLYAAIEMAVHVSLCGGDNVPSLVTLLKAFFERNSLPFLVWRICKRHRYLGYACPKTRRDEDYADYSAKAPLYYATRLGFEKIVEWLLENDAATGVEEGLFGYPLQAASWHKHVVEALLNRKADANAKGRRYGSALGAAAASGNLAIVEVLLERGADIHIKGGDHGSTLQAAAAVGHMAILELLLENRADVNVGGGRFGSPLQAAAAGGHEAIIEVLLEKGADVNHGEGHYGSALQVAAFRGHTAIVEVLLEKGADIHIKGGYHGSALQAAAAGGHTAIVNVLLERGADVNDERGYFGSPLQAAAARGHTAIVKILLDHMGANVDATAKILDSTLHATKESLQYFNREEKGGNGAALARIWRG